MIKLLKLILILNLFIESAGLDLLAYQHRDTFALRPISAKNTGFTIFPRGYIQRPAMALELTEAGWQQTVLTNDQWRIVDKVIADLRKNFTVRRNLPFYKDLNMRNRLRYFKVKGRTKGVDICCIPDEIFYRNVRRLANEEGVNFPKNWLFVARPFVVRDSAARHRRLEIAITNIGGEILSQMNDEEKRLYQEFLDHELGLLDTMSNESGVSPARYDSFLRGFINEFNDQFEPPEIEPFAPTQLPPLWGLQQEALDRLRAVRAEGKKNAILEHPTGSGKTRTSAEDAYNFIKERDGGNVLYLVHNRVIRQDALGMFSHFWPPDDARPAALYFGQVPPKEALQGHACLLMSSQYLAAHLEDFSPSDFDYIVLDEAHRIANPTNQHIVEYFNPKFLLGLTGTTIRTDRRDVKFYFDQVADSKSVLDLEESDILSPVRVYRVKTDIEARLKKLGSDYSPASLNRGIDIPQRNELIVKEYKRVLHERLQAKKERYGKDEKMPAICFTVSVEHAKKMAKAFREAGISAVAVHGGTSARQLRAYKRLHKKGKIQVLCACNILNEGVDLPWTEVILMARPTMSRILYEQQLGRGMRKYSHKESLILVDFVDNVISMQKPLTLHTVYEIPVYFPGQLALAPKRMKRLQMEGLRTEAVEKIDLGEIATAYTLSEVADMLEILPDEIWQAKEKGFFKDDEFDKLFVTVRKAGRGRQRSVIYVYPESVTRIREVMNEVKEATIEQLNKETERQDTLNKLRQGSGSPHIFLGLLELNSRNKKRSIYYRDEELIEAITLWLWWHEKVSDETEKRKFALEEVSMLAAEALLHKVKGPVVKRILRERLNETNWDDEKAYCAGILELKGVPIDKARLLLTKGLKASNDYYQPYLCARALLHMARRKKNNKKAAGQIIGIINEEIEKVLEANKKLEKYDIDLYWKVNCLLLALAEHYYEMHKHLPNKGDRSDYMAFILNYVPSLKERSSYIWKGINLNEFPGQLITHTPTRLYQAVKKYIGSDFRFAPESRHDPIFIDFEKIIDRALGDLDHCVEEFCEYADNLDDAIAILQDEIQKGRDENLWKQITLAWHRDRIHPEVMLRRLLEIREEIDNGRSQRTLVFFGRNNDGEHDVPVNTYPLSPPPAIKPASAVTEHRIFQALASSA